jgi:transketolase
MPPLKLSHADTFAIAQQIRRDVCLMTNVANSGHAGGPLSMADYATWLFFNVMDIDPKNPRRELRDRFVLSNGHCSAFNYAVLSRRGYFPPKWLLTFRQSKSPLQGHPNMLYVPGLEASTGSLGQGLSQANGMALGARLRGQDGVRVYCNCGDGELQEGNIWEAVMTAAHYKLDNLCVMVDFNDAQIDGRVQDVKGIEPLGDKWRAFNFHVIEADGHDYGAIEAAYEEARATKGKPSVILFKTFMMKGVTPYEDNFKWHGKPLSDEELAIAIRSLGWTGTKDELIATYEDWPQQPPKPGPIWAGAGAHHE